MFSTSKIGKLVLAITGTAVAAGGALGVVTTQAHADDSGLGWVKVTANGGLNVRSAPSTHAGSTGHLKKGQQVLTICRASGSGSTDGGEQWDTRWYKVSLGTGSSGWISGHYVKGKGEDRRCGSGNTRTGRTTATVRLREAPNTADHAKSTAAAGSTLKLRCKVTSQRINGNGFWYLTSDHRWVSAAYVRNVGAAPATCD